MHVAYSHIAQAYTKRFDVVIINKIKICFKVCLIYTQRFVWPILLAVINCHRHIFHLCHRFCRDPCVSNSRLSRIGKKNL